MKNVPIHGRLNSDQPIMAHDFTLTPQSRTLVVRFRRGGWVWRRPTAVLVEHDGRVERLPIRDLTRYIQCGLLGAAVMMGVVVGVLLFTQRQQQRQRKENAV